MPCDVNGINRTNLALCGYFILCVYFFPDFFSPLRLFHTLQLLDSLEPYLHPHCTAQWFLGGHLKNSHHELQLLKWVRNSKFKKTYMFVAKIPTDPLPLISETSVHCLIADWLPKTDFHKGLLEKYNFWQSKWFICVKNLLVNW